MAKVSAMAMARSVGVDPKLFRAALSHQKFDWQPAEGGWIVEMDSPQHLQMIGVLRTLFAEQAAGSPKAKRAAPAKSPAKKAAKKKRA